MNTPSDGKKKWGRTLTPPDLITERFKQGFDPQYRSSLYNQMRYVFGEAWRKEISSGAALDGGDFPDYADIRVKYQEVGRTRRIYSNQLIRLSRVMYSDPQPEFPQVDKYTAEVRKQFFLNRYRGEGAGEGEWADEMSAAYLDGDGLGVGIVQVCLRTNPSSGEQQVHLRHSPTIFTLWDPHERHPGRWRWIAFVRYMALEDAISLFGEKEAEGAVRTVYDGTRSYGVKSVRYFEYYDIGTGTRGAPTRAIVLNHMGNEPVLVEENAFGTLPFAYYLHHYVPGQQAPVGNIASQIPIQEQINAIEKALKETVKRTGQTVIDVSQIDDEDVKRMNGGEIMPFLRWRPKAGHNAPPVQNLPGAELQQSALKLYDILDQQLTVDSGVNDFDRGVQPRRSRTLGEDMLIDQRSQGPASWSELQCAKFHIRTVRKVLHVAGLFDRDPVTLDIFGKNYSVNDPSRPASCISAWLKEPSSAVVNADALRYQDVVAVRTQRLQQLLQVAPFVGRLLSPEWFGEELAKALGESDPKVATQVSPPSSPAESAQASAGYSDSSSAAPAAAAPSPQL